MDGAQIEILENYRSALQSYVSAGFSHSVTEKGEVVTELTKHDLDHLKNEIENITYKLSQCHSNSLTT